MPSSVNVSSSTAWGTLPSTIWALVTPVFTASSAQRIFGIAGKGRMATGWDADFTLVDLKAKRTVTNEWNASKCGWSPFAGMEVTGWPMATIIRGRTVMRDDEIVAPSTGKPVHFMETLPEEA